MYACNLTSFIRTDCCYPQFKSSIPVRICTQSFHDKLYNSRRYRRDRQMYRLVFCHVDINLKYCMGLLSNYQHSFLLHILHMKVFIALSHLGSIEVLSIDPVMSGKVVVRGDLWIRKWCKYI